MPEPRFFERRPDPPPAKVNAITLTVTGTLVWAVATAAVAALIVAGAVDAALLDVCFAGLAMGVLAIGWGYVHERRARRSRAEPRTEPRQ
ncbi:DUF2530 domain-containing protein [Georgenia ruanii]|uniref:DUF2530 domain-containing protein n=1 Tax=Georgenia ruanii TaxID=348442 RepID=A0A7J9UXA8_9MICO|nr:DUF2530 domain-containing protein [Georgenia ruanii]MPV89258.1 DUF2530 domain-containing protein [Georgenia ruanii]